MLRIFELIHAVRTVYPNDDFFQSFENDLAIIDLKKYFFSAINDALLTLDNESWHVLKEKTLEHFKCHREGQRKQDFFNHLNEAFAYQYLASLGYSTIKILTESKTDKTPDISYICNGIEYFCEVKTIGISQGEIIRRAINGYVDRSMYGKLQPEFFEKLLDTINKAKDQIDAKGDGLVFVSIRFDDWTYINTYRAQITSFVHDFNRAKLVIRFETNGELILN